MDEFADRSRRAVESLLENESLTSSLDDAAAQVLLKWGTDCAKLIVSSTAGLDAASAEDAMYPRMRALRRLMRRVNKWAARRGRWCACARPLGESTSGRAYGAARRRFVLFHRIKHFRKFLHLIRYVYRWL